jgi:carboxyl-terminal processing protease
LDNWQSQQNNQKPNKTKKYLKSLFNIGILLGIFWFGVGVGQGKIVFGPDAVFRDSVQEESLGELDYRGVDELYRTLVKSFDGQLNKDELQTGLKEGLVEAANDPYTEYLTQEESKELDEQLSGSFEGIGAELGKEEQSIVIISPIAGFPAEKAGLRAGDIVAEIDGETAFDISITEAVKRIRGEKGTEVTLTVVRDGDSQEINITRDTITIPSVETEYIKGNIGVMTISRFGEDTLQLAGEAAEEFRDKKVRGVILDLRGNPGGRLDTAVDVSEIWLDRGQTILEEKRADTLIRTYSAEGDGVLSGVPTVVLINGGSASASEIVAGALRDNKKATLIGEQTYGKGSVQELISQSFGGVLKVTIARWFTPEGINIDEEGIEPGKEVKLTEKDSENDRDPQRQAAAKFLRN